MTGPPADMCAGTSSGASGIVLRRRRGWRGLAGSGEVCSLEGVSEVCARAVLMRDVVGSMMPLISVTAVRTISFSLYSKSKLFYASTFQKAFGDRYVSMPNQPVKPFNPVYWFLSGATSGAFITFIACEFRLVQFWG